MHCSLRAASAATLMVAVGLSTLGAPTESQAQETQLPSPAASDLEMLVEEATRAVVLIDVRTAADSRQGSGFIVSRDGLILTNHHVIRDIRSARVKLASGDVYERISVLADDPRRDIAILQIEGFDLPSLRMGNSDSVRIGQPVVMIGSPLGLENTVSTGIISGRRQEPGGFQLLQTTAPASQGSSGGAVLSSDGAVVGVAVSQLLAGQNLNFAVPINYARGLIDHLGPEPLMVLQEAAVNEQRQAQPMASTQTVNAGLDFGLERFRSLVYESTETLDGTRLKRSRISYRLIETVGSGARRIERYLESETTRRTEPFGTEQTIRRERVRSLVAAPTLAPLESTGEIEWWSDDGWKSARHEVRFEGDRVVGVLTDSTGQGLELDRTLPSGILLRDIRDLAFGALQVDSLVGRSVEFVTFDSRTGSVTNDRYDILSIETIEALDEEHETLRVNVASGLTNESVNFALDTPRVPLRRISQDGSRVTRVTRIQGASPPGGS